MKVTKVAVHRVEDYDYKQHGTYGNFLKEKNKKMRVHVFPTGENVIENLGLRTSRPYKAWMPLVAHELAKIGIHEKFKWNQKAGCSCGCSPGFIVEGNKGVSMYIDIDASEPQGDVAVAQQRLGFDPVAYTAEKKKEEDDWNQSAASFI